MQNIYRISINWSNAGNSFIAYVPELSDCIADGKTFSEALENVKLHMEECIQLALWSGSPVTKSKTYVA